MKIRTLQYSLIQGIKGLFKNRLMTVASIGIISACLFILGVSYCILLNIDYMIENFDDTLSIVTFLEGGLTEDQVNNLLTDIESDTNVKTVIYTSPEEAWNEFKGELDANEDILAELEKDNPLSDSASFEIFLYDASKQEDFVAYINTLPGIRDCYYSQESIDVIVNFSVLLQYISLILISILLAIATLLIANTIKIGLFIRRHEINIMKYLGAKDSFIRLPFVIEGILIGLLGALIPFGIIYYSYDYLINIINDEFYMLNDFIAFVELSQIVSILGPIFLSIGIGIGIVGSFLSIRKHLRV